MSFNLTNLPESWNLVRLDSLCKGDSISYGVVQPGRNIQGGVPIIRVNNFRNNRIDCSDLLRVEPSIAAKYQRTMLEGGEVLITIVGSVGQVALTNETYRGFNVARAVAVIKPKPAINSQWIAYCLESPIARQWLLNGANTTVQTTINLKDLRSLQIPVPPGQYVSRVVALLSSIDASVETIAKQSEVLESIAQTLFKSWFVNFDPVRAKAAGRHPEGVSAEIAALFPSEFEESELGLIPKGWVISSLGSLTELINGFAFKSKDWQQDGDRVVKIGNVTPLLVNLDGCSYVSETTALGLDKFQAKAGEILVGMTGYVGEAGLVPIHQGKVFVNQRVCKLIPRNPTWRSAVFAVSRIPEFKKFCESNASGSAQANISGGQILGFPIILPSNTSILQALNRAVEPLIETIVNNSGLVANLSDLRDELLPRLISGKIRIEEAEEALADVMPLTEKQVA